VPAPAEYVALGAARQAAWARSGALPDWPVILAAAPDPAEPEAAVRDRYAELREATAGWRG